MIFNKQIAIGLGVGVGVIGLAFLLVKEKEVISKFLPVFKNFFGGGNFLLGYPKGVRNNNPGNIEMTKTLWKGEIPNGQNTDGRFKQFQSYAYGLRALLLNLKAYQKKGFTTIRQIIARWSPPNENDTESYIKHVSKHLGISDNVPLKYEKNTMKKLTEAIIIKENGKLYMNNNDFDKAWGLV